MRFTPIFLFSLASSGWANAAVLNMNNTNFGKKNHAPLDLASDSGQDLDSINFKEQSENTIGPSNSTSQNSVSAVSPSVNSSDLAFFVKLKGILIPLSTHEMTYKSDSFYEAYFRLVEEPPRNFSLVGTQITLNEGEMRGYSVGFLDNILSFGNRTKAADFQIDNNGKVRGNFMTCASNAGSTTYAIYRANEASTYCPNVELYLLPSFKPQSSRDYTDDFGEELVDQLFSSHYKNHTFINYLHGRCHKIFRDDSIIKTFVELKRRFESFSWCMTPEDPRYSYRPPMGVEELQENFCKLDLSGDHVAEYVKAFMKGFDGECDISVDGKQVFREPKKTWAESMSLAAASKASKASIASTLDS